ncbi:MAG: hypothetical protein NTV57_19245 [Cyanobacteria bacterium]|nr:hypothetical protein [Cyanobacteriota bacterium]
MTAWRCGGWRRTRGRRSWWPRSCGSTADQRLIRAHNHWAITLNALRSLVAMANGTRFEVIVAVDTSSDATARLGRQLPWLRI